MKGGSLTINMQGAASAEPTPEELRSIVLFLTSSLGRLPTDEDLMSAVAIAFPQMLKHPLTAAEQRAARAILLAPAGPPDITQNEPSQSFGPNSAKASFRQLAENEKQKPPPRMPPAAAPFQPMVNIIPSGKGEIRTMQVAPEHGGGVNIIPKTDFATAAFTDLARQEQSQPKPTNQQAAPYPGDGVNVIPVPAPEPGGGTNIIPSKPNQVSSSPPVRRRIVKKSHDSTQSTPPPPITTSFQALDDNLTSIPPDTHGAVGLTNVVTALNSQVRIQDRAGQQISTVTLATFWSALTPAPNSPFDPQVLYDPYARRWILTSVSDATNANSAVLLAVSSSADPTGTWFFTRVNADTGGTNWADRPHTAFSQDWITVAVNMFTITNSVFTRQNIYAFDKVNKYGGGNNAPTLMTDTSGYGSSVPAVTYDPTLHTMYLLSQGTSQNGTGFLRISTITGAIGSETLSVGSFFQTPYSWAQTPPNNADFAPQLGSTNKIQNGDSRIQNCVYRGGALWLTHTVFFPATGTPTRSAVQWWQVTTPTNIVQRGLIDDTDGVYFYAFPSIAVNRYNDVLIGYSRFATNQYASANYAFRFAEDTANTLRHDTIFKAGEAPYYKTYSGTKNRWGDYSMVAVDPINDTTMWAIQEYAATHTTDDRWGTWWVQVMSNPTGDFNRDGQTDILRRNQATGANEIWIMNGTNVASTTTITSGDTSWIVGATADMNLDGFTDILWQQPSTGAVAIWIMAGTTFITTDFLPTLTDLQWRMAAAGDHNYDGQRDLIWRHQGTGLNAVWFMSGETLVSSAFLDQVSDLNWQIGGTGDFNSDFRSDIVWRNPSTGQNAVWHMNRTTIIAATYLTPVTDSNWQMVGAGDYNADGQTDILWRNNSTRENAIWLMNGTQLTAGVYLPTESDSNWRVVGPK